MHNIALDRKGKPKLLPGAIASLELLESALEEVRKGISSGEKPRQTGNETGFTSRDVIFRNGRRIAWLRPASVETLLIGGRLNVDYNRKSMAVPEMIFCVMGGTLLTLCPLSPGRPGPEMEVCAAPFPNTAPEGNVCLNGCLTFEHGTPNFEAKVEALFFGTTFTHPNMAHPISSDTQLKALWDKAIERAAKNEPIIQEDFLTPEYPRFKLKEALKYDIQA